MNATALFVYGTLRHDQPEHAAYCRGVTGWRRARVRGRLFRIPAGYLLLVVPRSTVLMSATSNAAADETRRASLAADVVEQAAAAGAVDDRTWIDGELLEFRDATEAWPPLDAWENFAPEEPGLYPRCVVPVSVREEREAPHIVAAWAYVSTEPPVGSTAL